MMICIIFTDRIQFVLPSGMLPQNYQSGIYMHVFITNTIYNIKKYTNDFPYIYNYII